MKVMGSILGQGPPWGGAKKVAGSIPGHCASKMKNMKKKGAGSILGQALHRRSQA